MSHQPLLVQAIAEQRHTEFIGAAERHRLARAARSTLTGEHLAAYVGT